MDDSGHRNITREGLGPLRQAGLSQALLDIVVDANVHEDEIQSQSAIHFDNCAFPEGITKIRRDRLGVLGCGDRFSVSALRGLGRALHTIQDFYAHSSWIELHQHLSPVPVWDVHRRSLPEGIRSGTWEDGAPKRCAWPSETHDEMSKDTAQSARGMVRVESGPNQGRTLFELARDTAVRATLAEVAWFLSGITRYRITTVTGDRDGAGTDADVFAVLWGSPFSGTGRLYLDNIDRDDFERGRRDTFLVGSTQHFPTIERISIGYSPAEHLGKNPGWFLEEVVVENVDAGKSWTFPAHRWLAIDEGDRRTIIHLPAA